MAKLIKEVIYLLRTIPLTVRLGLIFIVIGVSFPVYGSPPIGPVRLTVFRLGLLFLLLAFPYWIKNIKYLYVDKIIQLISFFIVIRLLSLATNYNLIGFKMISWFSESFMSLIMIVAISMSFKQTFTLLYKLLILIGGLSVLIMTMQYLQHAIIGNIITIPFALSPIIGNIGYADADWYPYGVDYRIIGSFQEPNQASSFVIYYICLFLPSIVKNNKIQINTNRTIFIVLIFTALWGTGSRQGLVCLLAIIILFTYILIHKKPTAAILATGLMFAFISFTVYNVAINYDTGRTRGNVGSRIAVGLEQGTLEGNRIERSIYAIKNLDHRTFMLGQGEGTGNWASHNAFVIVLQENGFVALLILIAFLSSLFFTSLKYCIKHSKQYSIPEYMIYPLPMLCLSWALLMASNWAQMNQYFIWPFISLVFAIKSNKLSRVLSVRNTL